MKAEPSGIVASRSKVAARVTAAVVNGFGGIRDVAGEPGGCGVVDAVARDELEAGPVRVGHEDRGHRRAKRGRRRCEDPVQRRLEIAARGDGLDRAGERGAGIAGLSVGRHKGLLHAFWGRRPPHRTPRPCAVHAPPTHR